METFIMDEKKPKMTRKNIGIFSIPREFVRNNPDTVADVFGFMRCVPLAVDPDFTYMKDVIRYKAISKIFPVVDEMVMIPEYLIEITVGERKEVVSVKAIPLNQKISQKDKRSLLF